DLGLGLALVYGIVQESNGFVNFHSALLAGSTFEVLLPRVREPEESAARTAPLPVLPSSRGHENILVIEKDDVVRKMVAGMLTSEGYQVIAANSSKQARKLVREADRPVQLLIADPLYESELARELYADSASLRLLSIGNQDIPAPVDWLDATRQAGLAKPFAISEIS